MAEERQKGGDAPGKRQALQLPDRVAREWRTIDGGHRRGLFRYFGIEAAGGKPLRPISGASGVVRKAREVPGAAGLRPDIHRPSGCPDHRSAQETHYLLFRYGRLHRDDRSDGIGEVTRNASRGLFENWIGNERRAKTGKTSRATRPRISPWLPSHCCAFRPL
jgi:hypothetical protein